jgi:CheY-like chemotaxis protein
MLPEVDGFTLAEEIRKRDNQVPIIFLTAKSMKQDKIHGLTIGADDYITKPFSIEELLLKIDIFLRRSTYTGILKSNTPVSIGYYQLRLQKPESRLRGRRRRNTHPKGSRPAQTAQRKPRAGRQALLHSRNHLGQRRLLPRAKPRRVHFPPAQIPQPRRTHQGGKYPRSRGSSFGWIRRSEFVCSALARVVFPPGKNNTGKGRTNKLTRSGGGGPFFN